jgi:hypothetical protein
MKKFLCIQIILYSCVISLHAQQYKFARTLQGGMTIGIPDKTNTGLSNPYHPIGLSYTGNIKYNRKLLENLSLVVGVGIVQQIVRDKATLAIDSNGVNGNVPNYEYKYENEIKNRMVKFDIGFEFTFYNSERYKFNTLLSYTPGIILYTDIVADGQRSKDPQIIKGSTYDALIQAPAYSDGIKYGLNGEYKFGKEKTSSIVIEVTINQGLRADSYIRNYIETADLKKSGFALLSNKSSYLSLQVGYRVYLKYFHL